mgnify:CR=1 FL=1
MNTLNVEYRKVEALIPYARNPRTHAESQIAKIAASIVEYGWTNPILVDGDNGIIAGHGRLAAARKLGLDQVPVIELAHLTVAQKRALVIADNRLALDAGWDEEMLALELAELSDAGYDLALTGFEEAEIEALLTGAVAVAEHEGDRMLCYSVFGGSAPFRDVLNALAALTVGRQVGIDDADALRALAQFKGVGRRFQHYGDLKAADGGAVTLIDDYGHHPVEMAATLAAARGAYPGRRLVLAFQPHRYTRTRDCFEDFIKVLTSADQVVLAEVYAAGEAPLPMADGRSLARAVRLAGQEHLSFVDDIADMPTQIKQMVRGGDVVLCMGAGSIGGVPAKLVSLEQVE